MLLSHTRLVYFYLFVSFLFRFSYSGLLFIVVFGCTLGHACAWSKVRKRDRFDQITLDFFFFFNKICITKLVGHAAVIFYCMWLRMAVRTPSLPPFIPLIIWFEINNKYSISIWIVIEFPLWFRADWRFLFIYSVGYDLLLFLVCYVFLMDISEINIMPPFR